MSLATGQPLTQESWEDFVKRLRHDCVGEGANDHCTAEAIFTVQELRRTYGFTEGYASDFVYVREDGEEGEWDTWKEFLEANVMDVYGKKVYYQEHWEYVNTHFTKEAAQAFIDRKKHDYRALRIYVEAQVHCWEYNTIKQGILNGTIVFTDAIPLVTNELAQAWITNRQSHSITWEAKRLNNDQAMMTYTDTATGERIKVIKPIIKEQKQCD